ncbi:MAG: hypothetical protein ACPG4E_04915, partial [Flavobacteriaceae bacterium]
MAEKKVDSKKAPKSKKSKAAATEKKEEDKVETLTAELAQEKE